MQSLPSTEWLGELALRAAVFLLAALIIGQLLGPLSAARRYGFWVAVMAGILGLPLVMKWVPGWQVLPHFRTESGAVLKESQDMVRRTKEPIARLLPNEGRQAQEEAFDDGIPLEPVSAKSPEVDWRSIGKGLPMIWLVGVLAGTLRLGVNAWCLRRLGNGQLVPWGTRIHQVADELKLRRVPRLVLGAKDAVPMVWGVWNQRLLLPSGYEEWSTNKLRSVLLHELAHLARRDPVVLWMGQMACVLHWFNPMAWLALRRLRADQEKACDDLVLRHGVKASDYAQFLLDLSRHSRPSVGLSLCALAMARQGPVEGRVLAILETKRSRSGAGRTWWAMWVALGVGLLLPLAVVDAVEESKESANAKEEASLPPAPPRQVPGMHVFNQKKPFNGKDFVSLEEMATFYELAPWKREGERLISGEDLEFTIGSQACKIRGILHWLSDAVIEDSGRVYVSRTDLAAMIDPILRAKSTGIALDFDTVVIDPGHGGHDLGGRGVGGVEKELALELSLRLRNEFEGRGLKVVMTRVQDEFVSMENRVKVANDTPRSLLISIHLNSGSTKAEGIETFTTAPSMGVEVSELSQKSLLLARAVHASVLAGTRFKDRGVRRARWTVLTGCRRPGILFEAGFVTNENDAMWIKQADNQQLMVEQIATAIVGTRTPSAEGAMQRRKGARVEDRRVLNPVEKRPQMNRVTRTRWEKMMEENGLQDLPEDAREVEWRLVGTWPRQAEIRFVASRDSVVRWLESCPIKPRVINVEILQESGASELVLDVLRRSAQIRVESVKLLNGERVDFVLPSGAVVEVHAANAGGSRVVVRSAPSRTPLLAD